MVLTVLRNNKHHLGENMSNLPALTSDQINLIKATIAQNATDDELKLFLYRCREMNLDPLKPGQIFFMKYKKKDGSYSPGTIIIGRDGFRNRAAMTGLHSGTKLGIIRDEKGNCIGAWAEVYRKDWKEPAREEVSLREYFKEGYAGNPSMWEKMPETMIKKVAEVAALRMAFPDQLSGLYSQEEMDQATPIQQEPVRVQIQSMSDLNKENSKELQSALAEDAKYLDDINNQLQSASQSENPDFQEPPWPNEEPKTEFTRPFKVPDKFNKTPGVPKMPIGKNKGKLFSELTDIQLIETRNWCQKNDATKFDSLIKKIDAYLSETETIPF